MQANQSTGCSPQTQPASPQVLVTGAGGFIGSHLAEACAARGWQVQAMVRYNSHNRIGLRETIEWVRTHQDSFHSHSYVV